MKTFAPRRTRILTPAVILACVATVGLVVIAHEVSGQTPPPRPTAEGRDTRRTEGPLIATNRDKLAVCVEGLGAARSANLQAQQRVSQALPAVTQSQAGVRSGLAQLPRTVQIGCPGQPHLLQAGVEYINGAPGKNAAEGQAVVQQASPYRLHVYIVSPDQLANTVKGGAGIRTAAQEFLCESHSCAQVTTGLYLTPDELNNASFLQDWLARGLGLVLPGTPHARPPTPPVGQ